MLQIEDFVQVFKGETISNDEHYIKTNNIKKVIVFDIDETIGSFFELMLLWNFFEELNVLLNQQIFNELLNLFPEFLRFGIITIFEFLIHKKQTQQCDKIYIYTNNIYSPEFPIRIKNYFDNKLNSICFFDKVICAFKINNQIIEPMRTTNNKTYDDFIKCTILPDNTNICFIDDTFHEKMKHEKVYYVQSKPYEHGLTHEVIIDRLFNSSLFIKNIEDNYIFNKDNNNIIHYLHNYLYFFGKQKKIKNKNEIDIDILVTKKLMKHIKLFFDYKTISNNVMNKTIKQNIFFYKNKTKKGYKQNK
jgi:hypothetical protein